MCADKIELPSFYNLLNTTIVISNPREEFALPLNGKKRKLTQTDLIQYWGRERLKLSDRSLENVLNLIKEFYDKWNILVENSSLSLEMKSKYYKLLTTRKSIIE